MKAGVSIMLVLLAEVSLHAQAPAASGLPIQERLRNLQGQILGSKQGVSVIDRKLPVLDRKTQDLLADVLSVEAAAPNKEEKPPEEKKAEPMKVKYQPPLYTRTKKQQPVLFVCREGRMFYLDNAGLDKAIKEAVQAMGKLNVGATLRPSGGDFDIVFLGLTAFPLEATLRPNRSGESHDQIKTADSAYRDYVKKLRPKDHYLVFFVFPDSFDLFLTARQMAWDRSFELGWDAMDSGAKLLLR